MTETAIDSIPTPALAEPRPRVSGSLSDDAELIAACRRGEARAMEMLYHQFKRRVFGMAHRIVGPNDAEEVAQEVFVRVFRGLACVSRRLRAIDVDLSFDRERVAVASGAPRPAPGSQSTTSLAEVAAPPETTRDPGLASRIETALASAAARLSRHPRAPRRRGLVARRVRVDPRVPRRHLQVPAPQGARAHARAARPDRRTLVMC